MLTSNPAASKPPTQPTSYSLTLSLKHSEINFTIYTELKEGFNFFVFFFIIEVLFVVSVVEEKTHFQLKMLRNTKLCNIEIFRVFFKCGGKFFFVTVEICIYQCLLIYLLLFCCWPFFLFKRWGSAQWLHPFYAESLSVLKCLWCIQCCVSVGLCDATWCCCCGVVGPAIVVVVVVVVVVGDSK